MKRLVQKSVRGFHWMFFRRPLPDRLGVYFHTLDPHEHDAFAGAVQWIRAQGYSFASPREFLTAPGKVCSISFDDNFKAWHDALPLFDRLGIRAAFFTNTSVLSGECDDAELGRYRNVIRYPHKLETLSRQDIREMHAAGHWFGAHTHSHLALSQVSPQVAEGELKRNREILEDITGESITDLAFPFGHPRHFSESAKELAVRMGFKTIWWATAGLLRHQGDPLAIHRTQWHLGESEETNVKNMHVDGRLFVALTGRSPVG
jgi:peptidoglycan/xylan/chitin deacetylase (PgdA/CDA1 family)